MGACCSNLGYDDVGFHWWVLTGKKRWADIERLVDMRAETCHQQEGGTGSLLLHRLCELDGAPYTLIDKVLTANEAATTTLNSRGFLPLHLACHHPNSKVIELLIHRQPQATKTKTPEGWLPLHLLCKSAPRVQDPEHTFGLLLEAHHDAVRDKAPSFHPSLDMTATETQQFPFHMAIASKAADPILLLLFVPEVALAPFGGEFFSPTFTHTKLTQTSKCKLDHRSKHPNPSALVMQKCQAAGVDVIDI